MSDEEHTIGLSRLPDAVEPVPGPGDLGRARVKNLLGLCTPVANLGMVPYAPSDERWVGVGAGVVLWGLAGWGVWRAEDWAIRGGLSAHYLLVLVGLIHPLWPIAPARVWTGFGRLLGSVMAWPVFGLMYYLVVTPTALLVRLLKGDPLARRAAPGESYWSDHEPPPPERYERQF